MAKFPSNAINLTVNSVALEDDMDSAALNLTQETPEVTSFADAGPRRVVGNYDYTHDLAGSVDWASGQSDATIFALLASAGVATRFDPTGVGGTATAERPAYTSTSMVLGSYSINGAVGAPVKYSAQLLGNAAIVRAVA